MDFHTLPRRDLQALCKRNGIRANMSNAAMVDALGAIPSVEGIDEIRTSEPSLPEVSTTKSVADEAAGRKERHRCPLGSFPRAATNEAAACAPEGHAHQIAASFRRSSIQNSKIALHTVDGTTRDGIAAAATMDFHALPRCDLQALCKRNCIRANMSNAAMADALGAIPLVEGIDEIRTAVLSPLEVSTAKSVVDEATVRKERNGYSLPCGSFPQAATNGATAPKMEEAATLIPVGTFQMSQQKMEAQVAATPVDEVALFTGKRRTRMPKAKDREAPVAEQKEPITVVQSVLLDNKSAVVVEKDNGCVLPRGGCGRITRSKAATHEAEDAVAQEAAVPVEVGEVVPMGKRRTRRSKVSKVKLSLDKKEEEPAVAERPELKAESYDAAIQSAVISEKKRCDDLKVEAVINNDATGPQEGEMQYDKTSSTMRQGRRSSRQKVKMVTSDKKEEVARAVLKELIADFSNVGIESAVVLDKSYNDCNDEKVSLVEVRATNFQQGIVEEMEPTSNVQKSPSLGIMMDPPAYCVMSREESRGPIIEMAQDYSVKVGAESPVDEVTSKMNPYLDKFEERMYKFTVKEEKEGECWWVLL